MRKSFIAVVLAMVFVVVSAQAFELTNSLNTAADLMDIGGGTYFGDSRESQANIFDNDTGSRSLGINGGFPGEMGVYDLQLKYQLVGFTIWSSSGLDYRSIDAFEIQGSEDTADGYDGSWTTIYERTDNGSNPWAESGGDGLCLWHESTDTFLSSEYFSAFRLVVNSTGNGDTYNAPHINEIEFFGREPPSGMVLILE